MAPDPMRQAGLRAEFAALDSRDSLADDVLTAVVFGADTPCPADRRVLRIDLEPLAGAARCEVWRGTGLARLGTAGPIRHVDDGNFFAGWLSIDESRLGGILQATEDAYLGLLRLQADSPYQHVWRVWNFITDINEGQGDEERYRQFCLGRARAFAAMGGMASIIGYPAATAVGRQGGPRSLQVCWFAGREPGTTVENPRQVSAFHYPRSYGPAAPSFSRAMVVPGPQLLVSGTSSIVGHASVHCDDLDAQLRETLLNLDTLLHRARASGHLTTAALGANSLVKAYVRRRDDAARVAAGLREHLGPGVPTLVVAADICRSELLVEIEVLHRV